MTVPLTEQVLGFGKSLACPSWRYDHLGQGQALRVLNEKMIGRVAVIGAIAKDTVDPSWHLIQRIVQNRNVTDIVIRQVRGDDLTIIRIDADIKLSPGRARLARFPLTKALPLPLAWPIDLQPGAVDHKIQAILGRGRSTQTFKPAPSSAQRAMIGNRQIQAHQLELRSD